MRIFELFEDNNEIDDLISDLSVLLMTAKSRGVSSVSTNSVVKSLNNQGHSVSPLSLLRVLKNNPFVKNASEENIDLTDEREGVDAGSSDAEDNEEHVSKLAQKAAKKDM